MRNTLAAAAALLSPAAGAEYCSGGILSGRACCAASCGACGGTGCSQLPGGAAQCCTSALRRRCRSPADVACVVPSSPPYAPCQSAADCSLGGTCDNGVCHCYAAWAGPNCSALSLQPSPAAHAGAWYRPGNQSSWGGSVIEVNGTHHMYASDMSDHCGLNAWQRNSRIVHLTSPRPEGPYSQQGVVAPAFAHNPTVHRAPDGTFLIFHIGGGKPTGHGPPRTDCVNGTTPSGAASRELGDGDADAASTGPSVLSSSTPYGPWVTALSGGCNNPAAYIFPNGTTLLYCKVTGPQGIRQMQVSVAPQWSGPYGAGRLLPVYGEDAFVFRAPEDGSFHMLLHAMHPHKVPTTAWSPDGLSWTAAFLADLNCTPGDTYPSFGDTVPTTAGADVRVRRRERHQILVDSASGAPTHLFNGVTTGDADFAFTAVQPVGAGGPAPRR